MHHHAYAGLDSCLMNGCWGKGIRSCRGGNVALNAINIDMDEFVEWTTLSITLRQSLSSSSKNLCNIWSAIFICKYCVYAPVFNPALHILRATPLSSSSLSSLPKPYGFCFLFAHTRMCIPISGICQVQAMSWVIHVDTTSIKIGECRNHVWWRPKTGMWDRS